MKTCNQRDPLRTAFQQAQTKAAETWLASRAAQRPTDLIFFHASLHHIEKLEKVLSLCARRLAQGDPGLLYVDEYIGPSREEWTESDLRHAATLFEGVPRQFRQAETLSYPVAYDDPTEMVRSSEIEPVLRQHFEIIAYRPYYGNVLMPLVCGIRPEGLDDPSVRAILRDAMKFEDSLVRQSALDPMYAVFVGRPITAGQVADGTHSRFPRNPLDDHNRSHVSSS